MSHRASLPHRAPMTRSIAFRVAALSLAAAFASRAAADDLFLFHSSISDRILGDVTTIVYSPIIWIIEAFILNAFLKRGYLRCFAYAAAANIASTAVSFLWYVAGDMSGWKTAWVNQRWETFSFLLLRSFLVTTLVEWLVIMLILRRAAYSGLSLRAVAIANVATYALSALLIVLIQASYAVQP